MLYKHLCGLPPSTATSLRFMRGCFSLSNAIFTVTLLLRGGEPPSCALTHNWKSLICS
uniref:Uncharacterized protein n=1 Tax=Periophthalmus magnuspinnatus TaxID=409849 RepID=A0A3B3Z6S2_9GOBI